MKIALLVDWHSEQMGYSDNFLPKALASLGHEVHLVASNGQVYFNVPVYKEIFESFLGPPLVNCGVKKINGYTLHRLPYVNLAGRVHLKGLFQTLKKLKPNIVQAGEISTLSTYEASFFKLFLNYKLFVECHVHASVFPSISEKVGIKDRLYWRSYRATIGRFVSLMSERCYPISTDAAEIANQFFGFPKHKIIVRPLGTDTSLFKPIVNKKSQQVRFRLRKKLGFSPSDVVCIYTGRFGSGKNPLCLAQAIAKLRAQGKPFRGLFVGNGNKKDIEVLQACSGCVIHPFVPVKKLPQFYWAADIAVWPRQESTSQLDAVACGLPIILSNRVRVLERVKGNGLLYKEDDVEDLMQKIESLKNVKKRQRLGRYGSKKMEKNFSWKQIAKEYIKDYEASLSD